MKNTVIINGKDVPIEITAYTTLIYEDNFKGRNFFRDIENVIENDSMKFGLVTKFLWAAAKTADDNISSIEKWAKNIDLKEIIVASDIVINLIYESIKSDSPKVTATAPKTD